jgi:hypothetical protein
MVQRVPRFSTKVQVVPSRRGVARAVMLPRIAPGRAITSPHLKDSIPFNTKHWAYYSQPASRLSRFDRRTRFQRSHRVGASGSYVAADFDVVMACLQTQSFEGFRRAIVR